MRMCTIVARNYLSRARLLIESFRLHDPDVPVTVLVVDGRASATGDLADLEVGVVGPEDLPLDPVLFFQMATYYDVLELCTAVKPFLFELLFTRGEDVVMYLDPDIEVFAPLDELFSVAADREIALTPHITKPLPRDGLLVSDETFLAGGQFNLGFVALSAAARPFLDYWRERTPLFALRDPTNGYFTDQRWVDAVPALFPHVVVRDTTCNAAYWNLHERHLDVGPEGRWLVDGEPLKFFHFSGHDSGEPYELTSHLDGANRVRVEEQPALQRLLRERAARLVRAEGSAKPAPYRWARTAYGIPLDLRLRRLYWNAARSARQVGASPPPPAFGADDGRAFVAWLRARTEPGGLPRYLRWLWDTYEELRVAFPDPVAADRAALLAWATGDGAWVSPELVDDRGPGGIPDGAPGVNLVGYLRGEFGVAQGSRMVARMIRAAGAPIASTVLEPPQHQHRHPYADDVEGAPYRLSVMATNAIGLLSFSDDPQFAAHRDKTRVGVWYWEAGELPDEDRGAFDLVDEVWCASEHCRALIAASGDRPVLKHPLVLDVPPRSAMRRADLGLPEERFLFGFAFDHLSVMRRKNPTGLIDAYTRAFGPDDGAALVLKSINSHQSPESAALLRDHIGDRHDIVCIDRHLDAIEMRAFFQVLDCYTSLHRSEGLGLTIAAAMAAGTPAIATGYSGNLEFMDAASSVLLPYELVDVGPGAHPYSAVGCWAEPDIDSAAAAMRSLFDHPADAAALGRRARDRIEALSSPQLAAQWFRERFAALTGVELASVGGLAA